MSKWPLQEFIGQLSGFEFVTFWLSAFVVYVGVGFFIDFLQSRRGMGPFFNSAAALLGAYGALIVHDKYLRNFYGLEPYLTTIMVTLGVVGAISGATFVKLRWA